MFSLDTHFFEYINGFAGKSEAWDEVFVLASDYSLIVFGIIVVVFFFSKRRIFWASVVSAILSRGIITEAISYFYSRPRPFAVLENVNLLVERGGDASSFPSGHAAFFFAVAFAAFLFNRVLGVALIILALFFSFARVYTGLHYPLDILGAMAVSGICVYLMRKVIWAR